MINIMHSQSSSVNLTVISSRVAVAELLSSSYIVTESYRVNTVAFNKYFEVSVQKSSRRHLFNKSSTMHPFICTFHNKYSNIKKMYVGI